MSDGVTEHGSVLETKDRRRTLVVVALLLRSGVIAYTLIHFGQGWFFSRGMEMGLLADSVLHGNGLSSPFGPPTGPTAMVAPGYPLLVSVVFGALGAYSWASALCLMLMHAACNGATAVLIYGIACRIARERSSFLVALFWASSLPLLWMPTIFWETNLSALLLLLLIELAFRLLSKPSMFLMAMLGGLCGLAGLINPAILPTGSFLALIVWKLNPHSKWRLSGSVIMLVTFMLVFVPWPLRNYRVLGTCTLTRTTMGLELWMGNHRGGSGYVEPSLFPTFNSTELAQYRQLGEVAYMNRKKCLAQSYILGHPKEFFFLSIMRCFRFWTGCGSRAASPFLYLHGTLTLLMGSTGLAILWQKGKKGVCLIILVPLLLFPLPYYVTHAEFKYRLILDPVMVLLSAPALDRIMQRLRLRG